MSVPGVSRSQTAAAAVSLGSSTGCAVCKRSDKLLRCSRCKVTVYCTKEHQRIDWKRHKQFCAVKIVPTPEQEKSSQPSGQKNTAKISGVPSPASVAKISPISASHNLENIVSRDSVAFDGLQAPPQNYFATRSSKYSNQNPQVNGDFAESLVSSSEEGPSRLSSGNGWTSPITHKGSSEDTILGARAELLNPAPESSRLLNTDQGIVGDMPTQRHNGMRNFPEVTFGREDDFLPPFLHTNNLDECIIEDICRNVIRDMDEYGVCVVDGFLGQEKGLLVLDEVLNMYSAGLFKDGQLVSDKGGASDLRRAIRGDQITWLDGKEKQCQNIGMLISLVDAVIMRANKMMMNGKMGNYTINGRTKVCGRFFHPVSPNFFII